ncbi:hypothetical protein CO009_03170 [Candidatus Shapirobacteria bacterium CG_4_8_14_3_um_filter_35_11]|uniref:AB hydrolase-1 domain-containing protein n=4 Tax=Candidatus Shapironibacteriota TaxID=1752721 RepID=A0A1J5HXR8_9BACT|nr:MAG: hypothetical protein AUK05_03255 [Candidatus Shapirobacteria bacterium CG2_30_35_20]PIV07085.1 MAG: hypothetical protein COS53_03140 [Candidatus Shapirobacteria bacterium CG03_land_8_20_14_0_80_35_14]PJA50954.1 MAG: hypothetical protein CO168_02335 [Candidatus Shapirobacteria bacterium CG_4_9_14_3_um_filter_36_12]PJC79866.1 MAG: hypothetical protein CO009_03170 [Candidatus Shapirobacteria bacterium CG_4_8_14_3_um_filter_35_11]
METKLNNMVVNYQLKGQGKTLLFLHGWSRGINKEKYNELVTLLAKKYKVLTVDFPGFGGTSEPSKPWTVEDFAKWLANFLKKEKINPDIIMGHSFGGRVVIKGISKGLFSRGKLILVASAGIERKSFKVKTLIFISSLIPKIIKNLINFGSKDWREVSGVMKETMRLIVGENLENDISRITVPTLLIWGNEDNTTPLWQGKVINSLITNSELKIIDGANHGVPYRRAGDVAKLIIDWVK